MKNIYKILGVVLLILSCSKAYTQNSFIPDTTINSLYLLRDAKSSEVFYPNINAIEMIDRDFVFIKEFSPFIIFSNSDKTKYLFAFQHEGDINYSFSEFEIGYITGGIEKEENSRYFITEYDDFKTESNIHLGMTLDDLESIKGKNYTRKGDIITYLVNDINCEFLRRYNMPEYFLRCEFMDNRVCNIKFGFTYP